MWFSLSICRSFPWSTGLSSRATAKKTCGIQSMWKPGHDGFGYGTRGTPIFLIHWTKGFPEDFCPWKTPSISIGVATFRETSNPWVIAPEVEKHLVFHSENVDMVGSTRIYVRLQEGRLWSCILYASIFKRIFNIMLTLVQIFSFLP